MCCSAAGYFSHISDVVVSPPRPPAELSPGLAALTVGCDSGNLGSLSRVQLLLLDRAEPETLMSPFGLEEELSPVEDWLDMMMQYDAGLTAAGITLYEKHA